MYDKGTYIVKGNITIYVENDVANCLYIVKEGEVDCVSKGKIIRTLKKGDYFGEKSILLESLRTMDVVAKTSCICYSISVETFKAMSGEQYKDVLYLNLIKLAFSSSKKFSQINPNFIESCYSSFQVINFKKNEVIIPAGFNKASKITIVIEGAAIEVFIVC
jgi:CRP-like cAMP-binding protein